MALFLDNRFPLSFYYKMADRIVKEADVYREKGDSEGLCEALNRYSRFILEIIPRHPSYSVHSNEMLQHKEILQRVAKELEYLNSQIAGKNARISRCSTGRYKQSESDSHNSTNGQKDIYQCVREPTGYRTKSSSSAGRKHVELICSTATDLMSSYSTFQESPFNLHFDINVKAVKHHFPSPALSCVEAPPVIGHVSQITFPEPNKLYVESCDESSTSKATKDVHISEGLMEEFMELAKANTENDLETCGILGASLKQDTYYITTLVIPKQESTSSSVRQCQHLLLTLTNCSVPVISSFYIGKFFLTISCQHGRLIPESQCQALNEEEIHAILDGESLYPAGWIHTHPSQTCFLSSIDLHTQYSYQVMLPEAVAIVMAPTDPERKSGIFRLSDPGGINVVRQCADRGFHPHPETEDGSPIYENCSDVYINPNLRFEIFDMRLQE